MNTLDAAGDVGENYSYGTNSIQNVNERQFDNKLHINCVILYFRSQVYRFLMLANLKESYIVYCNGTNIAMQAAYA
jgi:hypothetical protein